MNDENPTQEPTEDWKDKYFRVLAEMENMRKRMQKEKQEIARFGVENAIADFLPLIDNFENALRLGEKASPEVKNWAVGFEMILSQFKEALHGQGIIPFHATHIPFDPVYHEAVEVVWTEEHPDGIILQEFTKGYKSATRVIRPARVKVARRPAAEKEEAPLEEEINNPEQRENL